jgi:hypothetical protein
LGFGPLDGLIVHIRNVHDVDDPVTGELEESFQKILEKVSPEVSDVGVIINRRAARIEFDLAGDNGPEGFFAAAEGIKELDHEGLL